MSDRRDSEPPAQPLSIWAAGGCMTNGYPLPAAVSFPAVLREMSVAGGFAEITTFSLGGFTASRAAKWILQKSHLHPARFIVIQLGSTDASVPVKARLTRRKSKSGSGSLHPPVPVPSDGAGSDRPPPQATWFSGIGWVAEGVVRAVLGLTPLVTAVDYANSVARLARELSANATVLVLTPFVMGDFYSDSHARNHSRVLIEALADDPGIRVLDVHAALARQLRHEVLLSDGFHLSPFGHRVVAEEIRRALESELAYAGDERADQ